MKYLKLLKLLLILSCSGVLLVGCNRGNAGEELLAALPKGSAAVRLAARNCSISDFERVRVRVWSKLRTMEGEDAVAAMDIVESWDILINAGFLPPNNAENEDLIWVLTVADKRKSAMRLLLEGFPANHVNKPTQTDAVYSAARAGDLALVAKLLQEGADQSRVPKVRPPLPLVLTRRRPDFSLATLLVMNGADINQVSAKLLEKKDVRAWRDWMRSMPSAVKR